MKYLLDTNICIYIIREKPLKVLEHLQLVDIRDVGISAITLSELEYGVEKSTRKARNKIALTEFLVPLEIMPYDDLAAQYYGKIRSFLERDGQIIGPLDLLIAAHALSLNSILVTRNEKEFRRIPELSVENWAT